MKNHFHLFILLLISSVFSACDTVAEITFNEEIPVQWQFVGAKRLECEQALDCPTGKVCRALEFSIATNLGKRLEPGKVLKNLEAPLDPATDFAPSRFTVKHSWLFQVDAEGNDRICEAISDCDPPFSCLSPEDMELDPFYYPPKRFCAKAAEFSIMGAANFTHFRTNKAPASALSRSLNRNGYAVTLAIDNSGKLDGSFESGIPNPELAQDPKKLRLSALALYGAELFDLQKSDLANSLQISAFLMNGSGEAGVLKALAQWITHFSKYKEFLSDSYPSPSGLSPVWEAILLAMRQLNSTSNPSYAREVLALIANPPNAGTEEVFEELSIYQQANPNIPIQVVHLSAGNWKSAPNLELYELVQNSCASYQYIQSPAQIESAILSLSATTESHWALPVSLNNPPSKQWLRLAMSLELALAGEIIKYDAQRIIHNQENLDHRFLLYFP